MTTLFFRQHFRSLIADDDDRFFVIGFHYDVTAAM